MATLVRWTPARELARLQDEMNRLFDPRGVSGDGEQLGSWAPAVDIYEDGEGITLRAEVPGMSANDIDVRIENGAITLKGERKLEREDKKDNYHRIERSYGAFSRTFTLPTTVDTEKVRADSKNGVLQVFLPKREETKPKQIKVKVDA